MSVKKQASGKSITFSPPSFVGIDVFHELAELCVIKQADSIDLCTITCVSLKDSTNAFQQHSRVFKFVSGMV